ncbi:MAG: glucose-1-phosphate adenylyltransferase [Gammaproteobacteria bacterium]|nr:MAG: glucose-1-phosphate adenylyltransferase [Gammaproteobacteria bacterium]
MHKTLTIILAGGTGSRLYPLTRERAKPAVPFGGKYRIIDFTLANCLHSGMRNILVLTQYKSHSLHKHLRDGWSIFNPELGEYITTVPPQMRKGDDWYAGTADAIHQNLFLLQRSKADTVLILSGDHIYRMDYAAMLAFHRQQNADVTIACMKVGRDEAGNFGIMNVDNSMRIIAFEEKPEQPKTIPGDTDHCLASMGIYIFSMNLLQETLEADHTDEKSGHDFGNDILPGLVHSRRIYAYRFGETTGRVTPDNYWRDVGTIDSFYEANMDLLEPVPALNLYQNNWPIRTYQSQPPPARTVPGASGSEGISINSIVAGGTVITGGSVQHSILFPGVHVGDEAIVRDAILFHGVHVGNNAELRNCIVDKGVQIPAGESIGINLDKDSERFTVSPRGVVVVPKHYRFG